jgi:TRAP-type mannitol/chloroaromatic compound transport system permease small subunit
MRKLVRIFDALSEYSGRAVSWLCGALVVLICYDVLLRYVANETAIWFQELEWHLFSLIFLIGASYTLKHDGHVRVDVFYARLSPRGQAWINLLGSLLLLMPFCLIMIETSLGYVEKSFLIGEGSPDPGGLPARYLIKAAIPLGFVLLLLQAIAEALRALLALRLSADAPAGSSA